MKNEGRQPLPFHREMDFEYGVLQEVEPGLRRFVSRNPGPFTFKGTNTYVIGEGAVAVVDPGPAPGDQLRALERALGHERITHILITHTHSDHSGAVAALKARTGAVICGMPRAKDDPAVNSVGPSGHGFVTPVAYDCELQGGDRIAGNGWEAEAIHTPGHAPDHLCYHLVGRNILLSGDHVMGWNTTIVAPPEGHMGRYLEGLERLMERADRIYYPGHGGPISEPQRFVKALLLHRKWREAEIAEGVRNGLVTIDALVEKMYRDIDPSMKKAASMAVFAQIELMVEKGMIITRRPGPLSPDQEFALVE